MALISLTIVLVNQQERTLRKHIHVRYFITNHDKKARSEYTYVSSVILRRFSLTIISIGCLRNGEVLGCSVCDHRK